MYLEIHSLVEHFFRDQGFSQVTIQPEFLVHESPSEEDLVTCTLHTCDNCGDKKCCNDVYCVTKTTISLAKKVQHWDQNVNNSRSG